jgi:Zn-dependent peptidase ImmA (M78 family)
MVKTQPSISLLAALRDVGHNPPRTLPEALRTARRQAKNLLILTATYEAPVDPTVLMADPKLELRYTSRLSRVSGACRWVGSRYVIAVNLREPVARQRFTIFHELKHAIDGAATIKALARFDRAGRRPTAELVADHFAACVLMPEHLVADSHSNVSHIGHLAALFGVSRKAMLVRLQELGLDRRAERVSVQ